MADSRQEFDTARADRLDAAWFARRPDMWIRIRRVDAQELAGRAVPASGKSWFVIVMREDDGSIVKRFLMALRMPPADANTLAVLADLHDEHAGRDGEIPPEAIKRANARLDELNKMRADARRKGGRP